MLSSELEICLNEAFQSAREARHEFMTVEHLLLAIVDTPKVREILRACGADVARLRKDLKDFIDQTTPRLKDDDDREVQPTLGFQRVLQRAVFHVQSSGKKEVTAANVLVAIFSEKHSHAAYLLSMQDVARLDVVNYISHGLSKIAEDRPDKDEPAAGTEGRARRAGRRHGAREVHDQPEQAGDGRAHRSADRPAPGDRAHGRDPVPPPQEQSAVRRRSRRRQDRAGRRPGAHDRRGQGAGRAERQHGLRARHGRADRRHEVSRRFREAPEGRAQRAEEESRLDPVHRRDPHRHRRRRRLRRRHGRLEPDQAGARQRRAALHRLDDLHRVSRHLREGPRARAALPEDRHRRAVGAGDDRDPEGSAHALRGASRRQVRRRCAERRGRARGAAHQRPPAARQGDRRDRRGRRAPAAEAGRRARRRRSRRR